MRFGFVSCVELGRACMEEIYRKGGRLDLVVTLPDDRAVNKSGRVWLDDFCTRHKVDLVKSPNVNDDQVIQVVREHEIDWLFIVGWSQIARPHLLSAPKRGVLGMHPTLLPAGRGRAAIPWAILKNLPETGVTLFQLDEGVDTGPIISQVRLTIARDETATSLYERVEAAHRTLMGEVWDDLTSDRVVPVPQDDSLATEWPGRRPEDGVIQPTMTVAEVDRLVRAVTRPYPGAFWLLRQEEQGEQGRVRVWRGTPNPRATEVQVYAPFEIVLADGSYFATDYAIESGE